MAIVETNVCEEWLIAWHPFFGASPAFLASGPHRSLEDHMP